MMASQHITIIGTGAFGTALALTCHRAGHYITLLSRDPSQVDEINHHHTNKVYFPALQLPESIRASESLSSLKDADAVILALPAQVLLTYVPHLKCYIRDKTPLILTSKGIIDGEPLPSFPWDVVKRHLRHPIALLSGPNFASELVENLPAAASLAVESLDHQKHLCELFTHPFFRIYPTTDSIGLGVAGAVKNILAIGCGMVAGRNLGSNATAALITRGLAEMTRLGLALGASMGTFLSLGGIGDLTLTCSSSQSRNFSLGFKVAQGQTIDNILNSGHPLSEGYYSLDPLLKLAAAHHVDMPLCQAVTHVTRGASLDEVIEALFSRPLRFGE